MERLGLERKKDVIEQVEKELPNIRLEFWPAYSPDYHLIELFQAGSQIKIKINVDHHNAN